VPGDMETIVCFPGLRYLTGCPGRGRKRGYFARPSINSHVVMNGLERHEKVVL